MLRCGRFSCTSTRDDDDDDDGDDDHDDNHDDDVDVDIADDTKVSVLSLFNSPQKMFEKWRQSRASQMPGTLFFSRWQVVAMGF